MYLHGKDKHKSSSVLSTATSTVTSEELVFPAVLERSAQTDVVASPQQEEQEAQEEKSQPLDVTDGCYRPGSFLRTDMCSSEHRRPPALNSLSL
ncbi:unnamed protein product [Pleuronectes platessa]|uniref:Uncharacterized protein n=1 Tax=Pleuronectes platessa TaxID=8262 RepID=A0A9N7Z148_PLEPL|nr:unnamed protein product [Pleuronectes platessa]